MKTKLSKRQSEIINAAIRIIGEGGIQALTIKKISSEIGVAESALYRHFKSRTEILETLLDSIKENVIVRYTQVSQSKKGSLERIKDLINFQLDNFSANPSYAIVILSDGLYKNEDELRNRIYEIMEFAKKTFIDIIEGGKNLGEIRKDIPSDQMAFIIMGSIRLMVNQWSLAEFNFDLKKRGRSLNKTICILIENN